MSTKMVGPINPRDYRIAPNYIDHNLAQEKIAQALGYIINIQKYAETPTDPLSFETWIGRAEDLWGASLLCKGTVVPFFFKEWVEQGSLSLAKTLENLDYKGIATAGKRHKPRTGEELSHSEKIEIYWHNHECTKWMLIILEAVSKGPYPNYFAPELSDRVKDECAKPFLAFMEKLGIDGAMMARKMTETLTRRRTSSNDEYFLKVFRTDLHGQLRLQLNGNGHVPEETEDSVALTS